MQNIAQDGIKTIPEGCEPVPVPEPVKPDSYVRRVVESLVVGGDGLRVEAPEGRQFEHFRIALLNLGRQLGYVVKTKKSGERHVIIWRLS